MYTVGVKFNSYGNEYHYLSTEPVLMGQWVVLSNGIGKDYQCVRVNSVFPGRSDKATKYIVDIVDDTEYLNHMKEQNKTNTVQKLLDRVTAMQLQLYKIYDEVAKLI